MTKKEVQLLIDNAVTPLINRINHLESLNRQSIPYVQQGVFVENVQLASFPVMEENPDIFTVTIPHHPF